MDAGAHGGEFLVDGVRGDRAARHIKKVEARALPQEPDGRRRGVARRIEVRRDLRAIAEFTRRANHWRDRKIGDARHVLQQLGDLALLPGQLFGVSEVLVLAAAAACEERTRRRHAMRRRRKHRDEVRLGKILVIAKHAHPDALAGQGERHHHDPAAGILDFGFSIFDFRQDHATQPRTEVGERGDLKLELRVVGERVVIELALFSHVGS
jgi:hypothetical protein